MIGCSTGGPPALQSLFQTFPPIAVPFVVAQHMPPAFTRLFAERVDRMTDYKVCEGSDGERLRPRTVYIAPGGMQSSVTRDGSGLILRVKKPGDRDLYAPSVDLLFDTASRACESRLLAIVLTGNGRRTARRRFRR